MENFQITDPNEVGVHSNTIRSEPEKCNSVKDHPNTTGKHFNKRSEVEVIDHDYLPPKEKKRKTHKSDEMYAETITILKDIRNTLSSGLENINRTLEKNLSKIVNSNEQKQN